MKFLNYFKKARLRVLSSIEPIEQVEDVVFKFSINRNEVELKETFLVPYENLTNKSDKLKASGIFLKSLFDKNFYRKNISSLNENDILLFFSFDSMNLIDFAYTFVYADNRLNTLAYDLSGKIILNKDSPISSLKKLKKEILILEKAYLKGFRPDSKYDTELDSKTSSKRVLKSNFQSFKQVIDSQRITALYHFTDYSNLSSIKQCGGLFSWRQSQIMGVKVNAPGGNSTSRSLDLYHGLDNYIRLSFVKRHPMMYVAKNDGRINNPVILEIDPVVILWDETRFSNMNATSNNHSQGSSINDFRNINFSVIKIEDYFTLREEQKPYYQAEVLIKSFISLQYISNIIHL